MRALRVLQARAAVVRDRVRASVEAEAAPGADDAALARAAFRAVEVEASRVLARDPSAAPACGPGCAWCCHVHVEATPAEVDAVVDRLVATHTREELALLAARARLASAQSPEARWAARVPCALLAEDRTCSVHEVRPIRCRAFHSQDASACRSAFAGVTDAEPPRSAALTRAHDAAEEALEAALEDRGAQRGPVLLEAGVAERLDRMLAS